MFASNCSDCTKTCTTHPLATILSSDDDIVVTINWSSLRTCANFVSLIKHRKGSKITSFVFSRNGQWGTYQKTKTNYRCQYLLTHTLMVLSMLIIYSVKKNTPNSYEALLETLRPNETRPNQTRTHQTDSSTTHLSVHSPHGIRICIKRKKIIYGNFFDFCAEKCVYNYIPRDQNPPMKGF